MNRWANIALFQLLFPKAGVILSPQAKNLAFREPKRCAAEILRASG